MLMLSLQRPTTLFGMVNISSKDFNNLDDLSSVYLVGTTTLSNIHISLNLSMFLLYVLLKLRLRTKHRVNVM